MIQYNTAFVRDSQSKAHSLHNDSYENL